MQLQEELTTTENQIAFARQAYNDAVLSLNTRTETFPGNIIATNFGFHGAEYFKGAPEDQAVPEGRPRADRRAPDASMPAASDFRALEASQSSRDDRADRRVHRAFPADRLRVRFVRRHAPNPTRPSLRGADFHGPRADFRVGPVGDFLLRRRAADPALGARAAAHSRYAKASDGARCDPGNGACVATAGAEGVLHSRSRAQRIRDRAQSGAFGDLRDAGAHRQYGSRGVAGRHRARDVAHRRLRHPHHDDGRGAGGRHRDALGLHGTREFLQQQQAAIPTATMAASSSF